MKRKWLLIVFCFGVVLSAVVFSVRRAESSASAIEGGRLGDRVKEYGFSPRQMPVEGSNPARQFGTAIADAVEKVMPSVVVVRTKAIQYQVLRDYFGFAFRRKIPLAGQGSGVIVDRMGRVLTSFHVVKGAESIEVALNDGTKFPAEVLGADAITDVAVLQIRVDGLGGDVDDNGVSPLVDFRPVEFGDSDAVRVGEIAIAIGSPYSLQSSVTVGHVSQKGRRVDILPYEDFIQTDAAINPGNSGGPLVDVDGRLIGINAAIQTTGDGQGGVGIAFAIPSKLAMVIAGSLIEKGYHEWPWVGAAFSEIDPFSQKKYLAGVGVLVEQVWRDTPAAAVGLLPGDVVLSVAGVEVKDRYDIYRIIFNHSVGDSVRFTILRKKERLSFELLLQALPAQLLY